MRTTIGIIGGGPAGLLLARLLHRAGLDCVVLESRTRAYVEQRQRAGMLEQGTVDALRECGAADRLEVDGLVHNGIELRFDRERHHIDFPVLTGGRTVTIYAQTEIVKDLIALQLADGPQLLFEAEAVAVERPESDTPVVRFVHQGREQTLTCDWVIGCDGFHGISRDTFPDAVSRTYEHDYPYSWLGVLADVPPSCEELIYARGEEASRCTACARHRCRGCICRSPTTRPRTTGRTSASGTSCPPASRSTPTGTWSAGRSPPSPLRR